MQSKITLYSDKELIAQMKKYAKLKKTSVSKIVNDFFKTLLIKENNPLKNTSKITDKLYGILQDKALSKNDYKEYIEQKYL